jgi:hypothetical protein
MASRVLFGISVLFSFVVWTVLARHYIWPTLRTRSRGDALRPILLLHSFRFVGLAFLVPGVVSPNLPLAFARPAAYGDLATATLALLALAILRSKLGIILAWVVNIVGSIDLMYAFYRGNNVDLDPGQQGAAYFITTVLVPLLLVTHVLAFRLLVRTEPMGEAPATASYDSRESDTHRKGV